MKILFILKERVYNSEVATSFGLMNSSTQVSKYLEKEGHEVRVCSVVDGNAIDKVVYNFKPNLVVIEALWVQGNKMKELLSLPRYKDVKWIIRIHSDIGFLAAETNALFYLEDYLSIGSPNLFVSTNNFQFNQTLSKEMNSKMLYLPNVVKIEKYKIKKKVESDEMHIGCFGALRVLKNQCFQAMVAIEAADRLGKKLFFHINGNVKNDVNPVLHNLESLFRRNGFHKLVIHKWMNHEDFLELISSTIDVGMQLSFTESFNIVTTDFINAGKLILVSDAISWLPDIMKTSTVNYKKAVKDLIKLYKHRSSWWYTKRNYNAFTVLMDSSWDHWARFVMRMEALDKDTKMKKQLQIINSQPITGKRLKML